MGTEVRPHGLQGAGGLRRRVHWAGNSSLDGVVVSMTDEEAKRLWEKAGRLVWRDLLWGLAFACAIAGGFWAGCSFYEWVAW